MFNKRNKIIPKPLLSPVYMTVVPQFVKGGKAEMDISVWWIYFHAVRMRGVGGCLSGWGGWVSVWARPIHLIRVVFPIMYALAPCGIYSFYGKVLGTHNVDNTMQAV